jgi:agmatinase
MKTFAGIPEKYHQLDKAKVVLVPVPYDGTSTWVKGADKGPDAFLDAAENMELYDIQTDSEVYKVGIHLTEPVIESESPEIMTEAVYQTVKRFLSKGKLVTVFGGEHSVSIGSIRAFYEKYDDLTVLQLDAHTDLRPEYHGSACNHACAVYEAQQKTNLIQVGIRSMDISEKAYLKKKNVFWAHEIHKNDEWMEEAIRKMTDEVYITIDLDAFDPSVMPSTGTPEPGGMTWWQVDKFMRRVIKKKNVVGFDIVELAPNPDSKASDFLAAKLYYRILSYIFENQK